MCNGITTCVCMSFHYYSRHSRVQANEKVHDAIGDPNLNKLVIHLDIRVLSLTLPPLVDPLLNSMLDRAFSSLLRMILNHLALSYPTLNHPILLMQVEEPSK